MTEKPEVRNRDLLEALATDFADDPEVAIGTMFRSPGLRVGGKVFAFLGFDGELIVKLPPGRVAEFVEEGTAQQVTMGKRTMREWIEIPAASDSEATLARWRDVAREAYVYVDTLRKGKN